MRNIWTIARREYRHYFATPVAYAVAFFLLVILSVIFYLNLEFALVQMTPPDLGVVLSPMAFLLVFAAPAITMRLLADEQRMGTLELLLTAPVRDWEVVVGKWLGALLFVLTVVLVTVVYPLILNQIVDPGIDQGVFLSGYLGVVLLSAALVALGVAVSSFFESAVAAYFVTLGLLLVLWLVMPAPAGGGNEWITYLNFRDHFYTNFMAGVIDLRDVIYYLSVTALGLAVGSLSLETRRWR